MLLIFLTLLVNTTGAIFIEYSWRVNKWNPPLLLTISEATKFCISIAIVKYQGLSINCKEYWKFGLPSLLYSLLNISVTYAYSILPAHYIITVANLKIVWAMCFTQLCLHRSFSKLQWFSAIIILTGLVIISSKPVDSSSGQILTAILFGIFSSAISSSAGAMCEYLYVSDKLTSIHAQNVKMYAFGIIFNFLAFLLQPQNVNEWHWTTPIVILYYALSGIIISFVMKYLGNVIRNLIGAITMICVTLCSHYVLENEITIHFVIGGCVVCVGTVLYNFQKSVPNKIETINDKKESLIVKV